MRLFPAVTFAFIATVASVQAWQLGAPGTLPPLWLHLPLTVAAGLWAGRRWDRRARPGAGHG